MWGVEDLGENPGLIDRYIQMEPSSERVPLRSRFNFTAVSGGIGSVDPPNSFGDMDLQIIPPIIAWSYPYYGRYTPSEVGIPLISSTQKSHLYNLI